MPILTLAGWKAYRGYAGTDYDTVVNALLPSVEAEIGRVLSCNLEEATYTDQAHDGTGTGVLYTRNWPLVSVASVKVVAGASEVELDTDSYEVETGVNSLGRITLVGGSARFNGIETNEFGVLTGAGKRPRFPAGRRNILVTYTAGYDTQTVPANIPVPADLRMAGYVLLDHRLAMRGHSLGLTGRGDGAQTLNFATADELRMRFENLIGPFRRWPL
jgi:hypothetical protein